MRGSAVTSAARTQLLSDSATAAVQASASREVRMAPGTSLHHGAGTGKQGWAKGGQAWSQAGQFAGQCEQYCPQSWSLLGPPSWEVQMQQAAWRGGYEWVEPKG
eukprot:9162950-Alexandrium_andersonii.AAC.1